MGSILGSLHINGTLLAEIVNFLLLLLFLRAYAWPPLVKAMEARRQRIQDQLTAAEDEREEAVRLREQEQKSLTEAREQAQAIVERAQRSAAEQARELLEQAQAQAERLQQQMKDDLARERDAAVVALRNEVADLVLEATGKVLRIRVDGAEDRRLVEGVLAAAGGASGGRP